MNITLLAEFYQQSHIKVPHKPISGHDAAIEDTVFVPEKFAELIVRECIEGIKEWRDASDEHMDKEEYWKGYRSGCNDAIVEIIQRLGIGE